MRGLRSRKHISKATPDIIEAPRSGTKNCRVAESHKVAALLGRMRGSQMPEGILFGYLQNRKALFLTLRFKLGKIHRLNGGEDYSDFRILSRLRNRSSQGYLQHINLGAG